MNLIPKEKEKLREYSAALIAYLASIPVKKQNEAYDYVVSLIEMTLMRLSGQ